MALPWTNQAKWGILQSVAASSITSTFANFGNPFPSPVVEVSFFNNTNGIVQVSQDGTNINLQFYPSTGGAFDLRTNSPDGTPFFMAENTQLQIAYNTAGTTPSTGSFDMMTVALTKAVVPTYPGGGV